MSHMLQKSSILRTLEPFFIEPSKEHYLLDLSRRIKLAHTSVEKNLRKLINAGFVEKNVLKKGKRAFPVYKAKVNSTLFRRHKKIYNLTSILESGLIEHLEQLAPKSIALFGSYSRGEDLGESDIDIFVECPQEALDLKKYEKKFSRKIELHFQENFTSYPKELKNNIVNGIVLSGFLEGYK